MLAWLRLMIPCPRTRVNSAPPPRSARPDRGQTSELVHAAGSFRQQAGVALAQLDELALLVGAEVALALGVGVHPGDEPFVVQGREAEALMALAEVGEQRAGEGGAGSDGRAAVEVVAADVALEVAVGQEGLVRLCGREVQLPTGLGLALGAVAADAVGVEDGLDEAVVAQGPGALGAGGEAGRLARGGSGEGVRRGLRARLVAADAAQRLPGLDVGERAWRGCRR